MQTLLGIKQNMTTRFGKFNFKVSVTEVEIDPNVVLGHSGSKLVLGMGKKKKVKKTDAGYVKVAGFMPRYIKEVKWQSSEKTDSQAELPKAGDKLNVSVFEVGDEVKVTGITKGKGFAGGVKRHGFHGGPKTHGQSDRHRAPGSIGAGTTPGRVYKGKRMAGHMGAAKLTVGGLEVVEIDTNKNTIFIKGAIPGATNGFLIIEKTGKVKGYTPPPAPSEEKQAEKEEKAEAEAREAKDKGTEEPTKTEETKEPSVENKPDAETAAKEDENAK